MPGTPSVCPLKQLHPGKYHKRTGIILKGHKGKDWVCFSSALPCVRACVWDREGVGKEERSVSGLRSFNNAAATQSVPLWREHCSRSLGSMHRRRLGPFKPVHLHEHTHARTHAHTHPPKAYWCSTRAHPGRSQVARRSLRGVSRGDTDTASVNQHHGHTSQVLLALLALLTHCTPANVMCKSETLEELFLV